MKLLALGLIFLLSQHHDTPKAPQAGAPFAPLLTGLSGLHHPVTTP